MPNTVYTEDSTTYKFFPVTKHSVRVNVKAANDAHIALSTQQGSQPMIEIFLGGWENSKSAIRFNDERPNKAEVDTPSLLSSDEAKTFIVTWTEDGQVAVCLEGASEAFITWKNDQPYEIRYFGVRTAWSATGDWKIDGIRDVHTDTSFDYQWFPVHGAQLDFSVQAKNDAHIALAGGPEAAKPLYEIFLGGWNGTKSAIRFNQEKPDVAEAPGGVSRDEFQRFWVRLSHAAIQVGRDGETEPFLSWANPEPFVVSHFGIRTSYGSDGNWILDGGVEGNEVISEERPKRDLPEGVQWVDGSAGSVPEGAFAGGEDGGSPLYVARAEHEGATIPGKLLAEHGVAYVPWGGAENAKDNYQVLVVSPDAVSWVDASGDAVPANAIEGGKTEDGETLYIGRVLHEGAQTVGKFHPSHGKMYISYGGEEVGYEEFQVLVQN
ncbi:uncharacterized protein LOC110841586 [Folsomia candida]|uniref:uncharacterized protein LOC110841586 n=1 Tax=Folsomia candida TaxID=158441 RepID=UPI000B8F3925|nr:uncharacterized protein LOC110841586 [Folsomia candida]XP_021944040.1 uncharacterized protein LOC110841586 [Folsomia candida]XP_021944816.1 uncharacterized protein LOC110841586 [Folsomia candida]